MSSQALDHTAAPSSTQAAEAAAPAGRHALLLAAAALAAGFCVVHARAFGALLYTWENRPMYSYGYIVPAISLLLLWSRREELRQQPLRPSVGLGMGALAFWALLIAAGHLAGIVLLEQLALLVALTAIVLFTGGIGHLRLIWPAIAYLLLMIPVWDAITEPLHPRFQLMSATIGVWLLQRLGVPVYQEGTFISLPSMQIEVARACSGINYLVAVLALGLPMAYLYLRTPWRRVALVVSALAIAILANGLRVALIGLLVHLDVGSPLHGPAHVLHGLFVAAIGHVVLFVGLWWLGRHEARPHEPGPPRRTSARWQRPALVPLAVVALVFWAGAAFVHAYVPVPVKLADDEVRLPASLGGWTWDAYGKVTPAAAWSTAHRHIGQRYRQGALTADVEVAYFEAQAHERELVNYMSAELHGRAQPLRLAGPGGQPVEVNMIRTRSEAGPVVTVFWYDVQGQVAADAQQARLTTFWGALRHRRTDGAAVSVTVHAPPDASEQATAEAAADLAAGVLGTVRGLLGGSSAADAASVPTAP